MGCCNRRLWGHWRGTNFGKTTRNFSPAVSSTAETCTSVPQEMNIVSGYNNDGSRRVRLFQPGCFGRWCKQRLVSAGFDSFLETICPVWSRPPQGTCLALERRSERCTSEPRLCTQPLFPRVEWWRQEERECEHRLRCIGDEHRHLCLSHRSCCKRLFSPWKGHRSRLSEGNSPGHFGIALRGCNRGYSGRLGSESPYTWRPAQGRLTGRTTPMSRFQPTKKVSTTSFSAFLCPFCFRLSESPLQGTEFAYLRASFFSHWPVLAPVMSVW